MIFIFTGQGKGKTTSAIGQGIRVLGQGKKVLMIQFIKGSGWPTGEEKTLKKLEPQFKLVKGGRGFVGIMGDKLPREEHQRAAKETLAFAKKEISSGQYDLIILDEINVALALGLLEKKEVLNLVENIPSGLDLILTGRGALKELKEKADLVTEFQEIKHPYQKGIEGQKGREY